MPGELEHVVKCRCNQSCTLDDISNTLQDVWKRTNIGKNHQFRSSSFKEKQLFRVYFKDKPKEKMAENCLKEKKKVYALEKVPEKESPIVDITSDSVGDAIRGQSDDDQDPREESLVEYQEETQIEIQDLHLEAGIPQDTENENFCKHSQDAQTFLVTPSKGMAYVHGTATNITVCIDNSQHPLIIESGHTSQ
ncbi:hypothetical protein O181_010300 [Austropuccinia psidii MF-1]|uniref:Uncharacterized protein n=1 Tax=Austropuccinia psidii MF-1 TaxID=1389203 RepID=A0A9Q3BSX6_9BASI|nr:hypothetical protein [Austropuccinia psidii MF-1]